MFNNMLMGAAGESTKATSYSVDNSALFNDGSSQYLLRTPSTAATSDKINTVSFWFKRGTLGTTFRLLNGRNSGGTGAYQLGIGSDDKFNFHPSITTAGEMNSTMLFRDPHAWYHVVASLDTTQSTEADRYGFWVNGVDMRSDLTGAKPAQNLTVKLNENGVNQVIAAYQDASFMNYWDGYLAEFVVIDGSKLDADQFGEYDDNGIWRPIDVSGLTFGNNGYYLNFAASGSDLGDDASGNGNDFTNNNSATQSNDSPTKNFCVLTPLIVGNGTATFSEGNLKIVQSGGGNLNTFGSIGLSSGKWHYEVTLTNTVDQFGLGIIPVGNVTGNTNQFWNNGIGAMVSGGNDGKVYNNGSQVATITGGSGTDGQTLSCEIDLDNDQLEWFNNAGSSLGTYSFTQATANGGRYLPCVHCNDDATYVVNFGASTFSKTPSTGFTGISAGLLLDQITPTIEDGTAYFQPTKYEGNGTVIGSGGKVVNQSGNSTFKPDFVWIKNRDQSDNHMLYDAVRGATKDLHSNTNDAQNTDTEGLSTFDGSPSPGFTVGNNVEVNTNTENYIAWQWYGDNTSGGSTNTDGNIDDAGGVVKVNVNTTAGFVVGQYTTPSGSAAVRTVGHGLGGALDMLFIKNQASGHWAVWHNALGNEYLRLNAADAKVTGGTETNSLWNATLPSASSTTFSIGTNSDVNGDAVTFTFYGFRAIPGYSSFGSYTGNGSSNGPLISLNFTPSFFLQKRIDAGSTNWHVYDTTRKTHNYNDTRLFPNLTSQEYSNGEGILDILSNGVKIRDTETWFNGSGGTFIYMAFAENPFAGTTPATAH